MQIQQIPQSQTVAQPNKTRPPICAPGRTRAICRTKMWPLTLDMTRDECRGILRRSGKWLNGNGTRARKNPFDLVFVQINVERKSTTGFCFWAMHLFRQHFVMKCNLCYRTRDILKCDQHVPGSRRTQRSESTHFARTTPSAPHQPGAPQGGGTASGQR